MSKLEGTFTIVQTELESCKRYAIMSYLPFEGYGIVDSASTRKEANKKMRKICAKQDKKDCCLVLIDILQRYPGNKP